MKIKNPLFILIFAGALATIGTSSSPSFADVQVSEAPEAAPATTTAKSVDAEHHEPLQETAHVILQDFKNAKKNINEAEVKQRKVMSVLFEINRKIKRVVSEKSDLVQEKLIVESNTKDLAERILSLEDRLKDQKKLIREKLISIYKLGGQGVFRIIFSATSSSQLERNLKLLGIVAKRDLQMIKDFTANVKDLENKKSKFLQRLGKLKKIEQKIKSKEDRLQAEQQSKNKILNELREVERHQVAKLGELRSKTSQLMEQTEDSGIFDLLFRPSFLEKRGVLPSPVAGRVLRNYGLVKDEKTRLKWSNKGILFSTSTSVPIKSVFEGKVAYSGEIPGFGQTIILDHGDHYYSVYGHNRSVQIKLGDNVSQGQVLAYSGQLDEGTNGLYFEIRHFSEPYDPRQWLKGNFL